MLCGWGKGTKPGIMGDSCWGSISGKKRMLSACWPSLWHHHTRIMSVWETKALGVTRQHSVCVSAALRWRVPLLNKKKMEFFLLLDAFIVLEIFPNNTKSHISATSSLCSYGNNQNVSECVWERSNCLFMCVYYCCVAYFYIMNQLSRLWRELIWIIADGGKRFCTQTWFYWASTHGISLGDGAALGLRRGCIIGHPTDIICLPICTLPAKTSFCNSVSGCGWGPSSASVVEVVTHRPLLASIGLWF